MNYKELENTEPLPTAQFINMECKLVGDENIDLDTFLSTFSLKDEETVINLDDVKRFCSIRSINRSSGFIPDHPQTQIAVTSTYFPKNLLFSIENLLESGHLIDDELRFYIWSLGIVASLSEEYTNYLIENGIFPMFFAILDIKDVYLRMTKRHVFIAMQHMLCSSEIIMKINEDFDFFSSLDQSIHQFWESNDFNVPLKILSSVCQFNIDIPPIIEMCVTNFMHFLNNGNSISKYDSIIGVRNLLTTSKDTVPFFVDNDILENCMNMLSVNDTLVIDAALEIIMIIAECPEQREKINLGDLSRRAYLLLLQSEKENRKRALNFIFQWHQSFPLEMNLFAFNDYRLVKEICSTQQFFYESRVLSSKIIIFVFNNYPNEIIDAFLANEAFEYLFDMIDETNSSLSSDILICYSSLLSRRMDFTAYQIIDGFEDKMDECIRSDIKGSEAAKDILERICFSQ